MKFETVFDVVEQGYSAWQWPLTGLLFVILSGVFVFRSDIADKFVRNWPHVRSQRLFSVIFFLFSCIWTVFVSFSTISNYLSSARALREGKYQLIEGRVTNFVPMPKEGHAMESFVVNGVRFCYSDFIETAGFHNTASHGGPIREGIYVRIAHIGNQILRLEIARGQEVHGS